MFVALDKNGNRVYAEYATRDQKYYCPTCGGEVILRSGEINVDHFAHTSQCQDNWNYDMTPWHRRMQSYFPEECREVVVNHNGIVHRADVLLEKEKIVIEFQHSTISMQEYRERTKFFIDAGYRIVWVFDLRDKVLLDQIENTNDNRTMFSWKNPMKIFNGWDRPTDYNKKFVLCFDLGGCCAGCDDEKGNWCPEGYACGGDCNSCQKENYCKDMMRSIQKVVWVPQDEYGDFSFKRFATAENEFWVSEKDFDVNDLFKSKQDVFNEAVAKLKEKHKYYIKYKGAKGQNRLAYICPKSKQFGLQIFGETGCGHCRHCGLIGEKIRGNFKEYQIYCCYPEVLYEKDCEPHDGYDYGHPNIYSI